MPGSQGQMRMHALGHDRGGVKWGCCFWRGTRQWTRTVTDLAGMRKRSHIWEFDPKRHLGIRQFGYL